MNLINIKDTNIDSNLKKSKRTKRDEKLKRSILDEIKGYYGDPEERVSTINNFIINLVIFNLMILFLTKKGAKHKINT